MVTLSLPQVGLVLHGAKDARRPHNILSITAVDGGVSLPEDGDDEFPILSLDCCGVYHG